MKKVGIVASGVLFCCSLFIWLYIYPGRKDSDVPSVSEPLPSSRTETTKRSSVSIPKTSNPLNLDPPDDKTEDTEETDRTPPLIEKETPMREKTSTDKFDLEDFQSDEERKLEEEFEKILEEIEATLPTREELEARAHVLISEARKAAPIADQYVRQIHELIDQKPPPQDLADQVVALEKASAPYMQALAEAQALLFDPMIVDMFGDWIEEEIEEIFVPLDWWGVNETTPTEE